MNNMKYNIKMLAALGRKGNKLRKTNKLRKKKKKPN